MSNSKNKSIDPTSTLKELIETVPGDPESYDKSVDYAQLGKEIGTLITKYAASKQIEVKPDSVLLDFIASKIKVLNQKQEDKTSPSVLTSPMGQILINCALNTPLPEKLMRLLHGY